MKSKYRSAFKVMQIKKLESLSDQLGKIKRSLKESDDNIDIEKKQINKAISGIEGIIADLIDTVGANSSAVGELISTVGNLSGMSNDEPEAPATVGPEAAPVDAKSAPASEPIPIKFFFHITKLGTILFNLMP